MAALFFGSAEASRPVGGCRGKPGGLRSRRGGWPTGQGVPRMLGGFCSLPRRAGSAESGRGPAGLAPDGAGWATPEGRGESAMKIGGLRGDILFESKEYPLALPKKDSRGDFEFPPGTPLKRPKEGLRPFLWKPSRGTGDSITKDVGTGDERWGRSAFCHSEHPALRQTRSLMTW